MKQRKMASRERREWKRIESYKERTMDCNFLSDFLSLEEFRFESVYLSAVVFVSMKVLFCILEYFQCFFHFRGLVFFFF